LFIGVVGFEQGAGCGVDDGAGLTADSTAQDLGQHVQAAEAVGQA